MSDISLIADSGIQFYSTKVNLSLKSPAMKTNKDFYEKIEVDEEDNKRISFVFPYYYEKQQRYIELTDEIKKVATDEKGFIDEDKIPRDLIVKIPEHKITTVRARHAVESYEGMWLPVPFLRKSYDGKKFQQGPETWARMWISRISGVNIEDSEYTHNIVFAFDTRTEDNNSTYLTPTKRDAENSVFECATDANDSFFFCAREWVQNWLNVEFKKRQELLGKTDQELHFLATFQYLSLLEVLEKGNAFPRITLHTNHTSIEVDLILDVGNSRTCGILIESTKAGQAFHFTDAVPLELRNLTHPEKSDNKPFDMRLAFVKADLGDESAGIMAGNPKAFSWPSLVRVGSEASDWSVLTSSSNSNAIMSSPKRYLWDDDKRIFPWTYISREEELFSKPALYGMSPLFTDDGKLLEEEIKRIREFGDEDTPEPFPAMNPYYSRSSLMTFALSEIFLQAITFVNSYKFRDRQGQAHLPRKLKRIVLTCPTAMIKTEQYILRKHAKEAMQSLKSYFSDSFIDDNLTIIPDPDDIRRDAEKKQEWGYDEATASQLAYVYGEIHDRFMDNAKLYVNTVGKMRSESQFPDQPSVTIASVDIGGGTTDLMIASYQANPKANISVLTPKPEFWEGFNLAGDDILKRVIERIVLPGIMMEADKMGCQNTIGVMNILFGPYLGSTDAKDKLMKKQFANQVALPIGFGVLQHAAEERDIETIDFDSFFINYPKPNKKLVNYINEKFQEAGAKDFDLEKLTWTLETKGTDKVVKDVIEKMIGDLCGVISQYHCDYVLLAGRPTTLPVIRDLFLKYLPTTPDRVVPMGHYRIGKWYPFAEETGVIKDPKTCVSVGASVALMAGTLSRLENFSLDINLLKTVESTADFIGKFDKNKAQVTEAFFDPYNDNATIEFYGTTMIGMRQMDIKNWIGTPMYKLTYANNDAAKNLKNRLPLTIELERNPRDKENFKNLKNVIDKNGKKVSPENLVLKLQSLADEHGYWLDTGIFLIQLFDEA